MKGLDIIFSLSNSLVKSLFHQCQDLEAFSFYVLPLVMEDVSL